jgi:hypothetical protein
VSTPYVNNILPHKRIEITFTIARCAFEELFNVFLWFDGFPSDFNGALDCFIENSLSLARVQFMVAFYSELKIVALAASSMGILTYAFNYRLNCLKLLLLSSTMLWENVEGKIFFLQWHYRLSIPLFLQ